MYLGYGAIEKSARIAAVEASADGICWTFSPMVDICRDARWGRVSEGNGEDPYLALRLQKLWSEAIRERRWREMTKLWLV